MSVVVGRTAAEKKGKVDDLEQYEDELKEMAEAYKESDNAGTAFVHIRDKYSTNRDLRQLQRIVGGGRFFRINSACGADTTKAVIGVAVE